MHADIGISIAGFSWAALIVFSNKISKQVTKSSIQTLMHFVTHSDQNFNLYLC